MYTVWVRFVRSFECSRCPSRTSAYEHETKPGRGNLHTCIYASFKNFGSTRLLPSRYLREYYKFMYNMYKVPVITCTIYCKKRSLYFWSSTHDYIAFANDNLDVEIGSGDDLDRTLDTFVVFDFSTGRSQRNSSTSVRSWFLNGA